MSLLLPKSRASPLHKQMCRMCSSRIDISVTLKKECGVGRGYFSTQMGVSMKANGAIISRMDMEYSPTQMAMCMKESI